ncbi:MAG TPA: M20/M25/M40 family metallo-hydrolase, partial [Pyrinomonadaceae bacterium]|nr:M20/M25/M40 family metallo-hydrolase [Pyrinomonadaceae bacterium]
KTLVTYNTPELVKQMLPSLEKSAGKSNVLETEWVMGAEDFSYYRLKAPAFFFQVGGMPKGMNPKDSAPHHTPDFFIDDSRLDVGVKAFCNIVFDYQKTGKTVTASTEKISGENFNERISMKNCFQSSIISSPFQPFAVKSAFTIGNTINFCDDNS